ncbi:MAG: pyridoxamine 5'-phosphate oxidase family protein [Candidatus Saelkia tenebricola]|nr:pyridoxamine 5'-phosphate oxidase family protein [Candidatus Saelkia tenebricola]
MIVSKLNELLKNATFIDVATCDFEGRPNAAPKFLLKHEGNCIYLIDYTIGKTYYNININPKVSLPAMNFDTLNGYQINGDCEIIEKGPEYEKLTKKLHERVKNLSVERLVSGIKEEKPHVNFEITFPKSVIIFKVIVKEIVEIGSTGGLRREKVR